jgi:uncharacterized delta-60 repeat protein
MKMRPRNYSNNKTTDAQRRAATSIGAALLFSAGLFLVTVIALASPGGLDPSFNGTGAVITPFGTGQDTASAVIIQPDGKILAVGDTFGATRDFALTRYNTDGSLDSSFDGDGKVTTDFSNSSNAAYAAALQTDGKIIAAGNSVGARVAFALARYNQNGTLDTSFGVAGKVTTNVFNGCSDTAYAVAVQADGKIVAAGTTDCSGGSHSSLAVVRYDPDGSVDSSFGTNGGVAITFDIFVNVATAVVIQPDGKIVAAGSSYSTSSGNFAVARFNPNGSLDTTFDGDGKVITDFGSPVSVTNDHAYGMTIQADGNLVVAGYSNSHFALARYSTDGSLDTSFGGTGKVITDFGGIDEVAFGVTIEASGKIVAAGYSSDGIIYSSALARYSTNGALDPKFGNNGKVLFTINNKSSEALAVAIQADGKIVAAGSAFTGTTVHFGIARVLTKGDQTITFGAISTKTFGDADFALNAMASSALPVTYSANGQCAVMGNVVHLTSAGSCTITASQAGDTDYNPATPVSQSFKINKGLATIVFGNLTQFYDGNPKLATVSTTPANLNLTISYSPVVSPTNLGSYSVFATVNDPNYDGSQQATLTIIPQLAVDFHNHIVAFDSVTFVAAPFPIITTHNFSADQHTRVMLFVYNLGLSPSDVSSVTSQAGGVPLSVEQVGTLSDVPSVSYVIVKLSDQLPHTDLTLTISVGGVVSNVGVISINP